MIGNQGTPGGQVAPGLRRAPLKRLVQRADGSLCAAESPVGVPMPQHSALRAAPGGPSGA